MPGKEAVATAGSVAKIVLAGGHGSGVHIGGGYIVTAAHVTPKGGEIVTAKFDDDTERKAEVMWANEAYDIALLRIADPAGIDVAPLACRVPDLHESVIAKGNPLSLANITTRGWVAGGLMSLGPWRSVVTLSIPIAGGMSGGGLFDASGRLVGILVGAPVQPIGYGATFVGLALAVDGRTVCDLLARA
jgi:serine protease Do